MGIIAGQSTGLDLVKHSESFKGSWAFDTPSGLLEQLHSAADTDSRIRLTRGSWNDIGASLPATVGIAIYDKIIKPVSSAFHDPFTSFMTTVAPPVPAP